MNAVNIGSEQRMTRGTIGVVSLLGAIAVSLAVTEWVWYWYLLQFFLVFNGVLTLLEARNGVCPMNAMQNKQSMTGYFSIGQEPLENMELADELRWTARRETLQAFLVGLGVVVLTWAIWV